MSTPAAELSDALARAECEPKQGRSGVTAICPVCRTGRSLRIVNTAAGAAPECPSCSRDDIAKAIGVHLRAPAPTPSPPGRSGSAPKGGNGNTTSGNVWEHRERPLFEPLGAYLDRTANLPEPTWLLRDLVPDAGRLFIVARPNAGKTFLALVVAKTAAATGRPVYLVLEEGGARRTGDRFRNMGVAPTAPVHVAHLRGVKLGDQEATGALVGILKSHDAPILVLDPFAAVFDGDENDTREVNKARAHLDALVAANERALLVLCHHTSKAGERGDGGPGMHAARGSSVLSGWADVQLNLKSEAGPRGAGRVVFVAKVEKNRDGECGQSTRVSINLGADPDAPDAVTLEPVTETAPEDRAARVLELAAANPGLSRNALAKKVGGRRTTTLAALDRLAGEGKLEKRDGGLFGAAGTEAAP